MSSTLQRLTSSYAKHLPLAEDACKFLTASPDPFHAVAECVKKLEQAGFRALQNKAAFTGNLEAGGKYYYTVHQSTLVAFTVGQKYVPGQGGFHVIGGHTDSPNLKVKPRSLKPPKNGCIMLGVECYGGGLWNTWFDRDLGISGKILVRSPDGKIESKLVNITDPVARVSNLCIHLQSGEERKAFKVNKEDHTSPILATEAEMKKVLEESTEEQLNKTEDSWKSQQEPLLLQLIAEKLGIPVEQIADFELNLYDTQGAALGGVAKEFLYSARLDNLATVFVAMEAILAHTKDGLADDEDIKVVVFFDHEEVGSDSSHGAGSPVIEEAIRRISAGLGSGADSPDLYAQTINKSFILSIDQAHAVHPNYAGKHEATHAPKMNAGLVIKTNQNQRYATNGVTGFVLRELARMGSLPIQEFCVRNDCPCGSTIGPTISTRTGVRTVDAGMPQLSMHSCREVMGTMDLTHGVELFKTFFKRFRELDEKMDF
ncbi:M18 family aminopeptidase 2 [Seminavis robusta]|uniref:aspartyl aminopeptidase n=1 Tax=Seminavis robusta TaxID=568900 RepID=A0A9N8HUQ2_9STRA|nr:M18 family aminopeptidase 2 [Seminavis robusta]|eukprot:Sro2137_g316040.1 M18 family aminopeptidase 2 (486) ;mRNA; r:10804-12601